MKFPTALFLLFLFLKHEQFINARVLKELHAVIIEPLTLLFNNSLNQDMAPQGWKEHG